MSLNRARDGQGVRSSRAGVGGEVSYAQAGGEVEVGWKRGRGEVRVRKAFFYEAQPELGMGVMDWKRGLACRVG